MLKKVLVSQSNKEKLVQKFRSDLFDPKKEKQVRSIIEGVKKDKDKALISYIKRFEGIDLKASELKVSSKELGSSANQVDKGFLKSLKLAAKRIESFHKNQLTGSWFKRDEKGIVLGQLVRAIERVAIYVPGGQASYPSSVLMNAIPAKIAGVKEIVMVTPAMKNKKIDPKTLAAANLAGITEIYKVGGVQAVAALAFGTQTIEKVDKIVGPGNIYVTLAKKMVVGQVDIDMLAGPSEVVIVCDSKANPKFIAADLLAQAEHDSEATAILISNSAQIVEKVKKELEEQLKTLKRANIAKESLRKNGRAFIVNSLKQAFEMVNLIAPEHLEVMVSKPNDWIDKINNAGAVFVGNWTPEALGDYVAGPNHVLPTLGSARFYSPLGVYSFLKKSSYISFDEKAFGKLAKDAVVLADSEELQGHAQSVRIRMEK